MNRLLIIAIGLMGFSISSFAQATASATATATIISPMLITKTVDMNFGNVAVGAAGTVVLTPASARTATGGVTLPAVPGTVTAATFKVEGENNFTYSITLPSVNHTITRISGLQTMIVNAFTSTPSGVGTLIGNTQFINIGATLNVSAAQLEGVYTNATGFPVTVNYN